MSDSLHILYQQISDITKPLCLSGTACKELAHKPFHCCEKKYCDLAAKFALEGYGIILQSTGHEIPFMGVEGCTIPLHLRPICTIHCCKFSWADKVENNVEYFTLRHRILTIENKAGRLVNICL